MSHSDYRTLIDHGRKAGLKTSDLYAAMKSRPPEGHEDNGQTDGNGFAATLDENGHRVFRPDGGAKP